MSGAFHPEIELAWLTQVYRDGLLSRGDFEREVLLHQANIGMMHLVDAMLRGNESFKDIAVSGLRAWLEQWSERYA